MSPDSPPAQGYFPAFGYRDFRLYWWSQFVSHCGVWMQIMAQSWALYEITGSAIGVGLNGLFRAAPSFGFGFLVVYSLTAMNEKALSSSPLRSR